MINNELVYIWFQMISLPSQLLYFVVFGTRVSMFYLIIYIASF